MSALETQEAVQTLEIIQEQLIAAPVDVVFETILEQLGPLFEAPDGTRLGMKLEARPGGRWYRDFGDDMGHFWGHVQAIKAPSLIEINGPLFMSTPAISNLQYRLSIEGDQTRLKFSHRAAGWILAEHRDGIRINGGWAHMLTRVKNEAEQKKTRAVPA